MPNAPGAGRPAASKNRIVEDFRSRIIVGELSPGSRFPARTEIERQYGAGPTTVQRALDSLKQEGFIRVNGRVGTFVADNPPHLSRYAVVFAKNPADYDFGQFQRRLSQELDRVAGQKPECQLVPYYDVDGHEGNEDFARLCREIATQQIAGLIFTSYPYQLLNTPLLSQPGIPRVAIMSPLDIPIPIISPDYTLFLTRALDYLAEQGHRRIAFLQNVWGLPIEATLDALLKERKMETRPYWCQFAEVALPQAAYRSAQLLMLCRDVPDALVICDDNLVENATAGLNEVQPQIPQDFTVVAHANFPDPTPSRFSTKRLGFNVPQVLQLCVDNINAQRHGEVILSVTTVSPCFEEELALPTCQKSLDKKRVVAHGERFSRL